MYSQKKSFNILFTVLSDAATNERIFKKKNTFQNTLINFKEKTRWKYCFIIVFPNANKTILKETKLFLLIKGSFSDEI